MTPASWSIRNSSAPVVPTKVREIFASASPCCSPTRRIGLLNLLVLEPTDALTGPVNVAMGPCGCVRDLSNDQHSVVCGPEGMLHVFIDHLHSAVIAIDRDGSHLGALVSRMISRSRYHWALRRSSTISPFFPARQIYA